jgi:hypothetical protein
MVNVTFNVDLYGMQNPMIGKCVISHLEGDALRIEY